MSEEEKAIALFEDSEYTLSSLPVRLRIEGYKVIIAKNMAEAEELINKLAEL